MKGSRTPVRRRVLATLAVFAAAVGVAVAAVSLRGDGETPSPRPYAHADVLHVFNATGIRGLQTGGGGRIGDHEPERPDGYYVSVQGGGNWSATLFDDVSSAAAYERFIAKSLAEAMAAEKKMWATNTTEPQWSSATVAEKSSAAQEKPKPSAPRQEALVAQLSIARCANVVVGGVGNEPERVCESLAKLPAALEPRNDS